MIELTNISFTYPGVERPSLNNLSFKVAKGKLLVLCGGNGCGKTTLLCFLAGIFAKFGGKASISGFDPAFEGQKLRKQVAYVPQNPDLYLLGSTLREDLFLGLSRQTANLPETVSRSELLLQEFALQDDLDTPLHNLSYGQRRKACLASALLGRPGLLLLDEPFAGLDYSSVLHLRQTIKDNRREGITQVIAEHNLELVADLADEFALLKAGELLAKGIKEEVAPRLIEANVRPPCTWV